MFAHIDADAFFASVLERKNPKLKGQPILALGMGGGFVIAASYPAKAKGVKTGMRLVEARKFCPNAVPVVSDFLESCVVSKDIESILGTYCPRIEKTSIDEWYLDLVSCVGGVPEKLYEWAKQIQTEIKSKIDVSVSIGIAPTKLLAKMAGEYRKPAGITIVVTNPESINSQFSTCGEHSRTILNSQFLSDRPAPAIPGIGSKRSLHAESFKWRTAWDIANAPKDLTRKLFGRPGLEMQDELLGKPVFDVDDNPAPPKSISRCRSFRATKDQDQLFGHVLQHLTYCTLKMRTHNLACKEVMVWIRDDAYRHFGHPRKLPQLMDTEEQILPYTRWCFKKVHEDSKSYTQVGIALMGLKPPGNTQYSLFDTPESCVKSQNVQKSLDSIRKRYGRDSVLRGRGLVIPRKWKSNTPDFYGGIKEMS